MALDHVESRAMPRLLFPALMFDLKLDRMPQIKAAPRNAAMEWRQTILSIVQDALQQVGANHAEEEDIWRQEARCRALNFAELGFAEFHAAEPWKRHGNRSAPEVAAVATLGGAYRLLARCNGEKPVQCVHILRKFLHNLALAYAPVCGKVELDLDLCAIVMAPARCRALILCTGLLIQQMLHYSAAFGPGAKLNVALTAGPADDYALAMRFVGCTTGLLDSSEFALASRLAGMFQAEFLCTNAPAGRIDIELNFPATP